MLHLYMERIAPLSERSNSVSHDSAAPAVASDVSSGEPVPAKKDRPGAKLAAILVGVPAVLIVMLMAFLLPTLNSGAHNLPLGVSGPAQVADQVVAALDEQSPDAFEVTTFDSAADARDAVLNREQIGAISIGESGVSIVIASGAGTPYAPLLKQVGAGLEAAGQTVTYDDVAPLTEEDPTGSAIAVLGLPLVFGGNISAILLITLLKNYPRLRLVGGVLMSVTGGVATAAVMQYGLGVIDGNFALTAAALSLGIAAIGMTLQGLHNLWGMAGLGVAGVLLLFLANPLGGLATGPWWLPAPWGAIGQILPIGAAGTAVRSAAFFDGAGGSTAFIVLGCWAVIGFLLSAFISRHKSRKTAALSAAVIPETVAA